MKLCILGLLFLGLTSQGSVTRCPDCTTEGREAATAMSASTSPQPAASVDTTAAPSAASSMEQSTQASGATPTGSAASMAAGSTASVKPTMPTTTTTTPGLVSPPVHLEQFSVGCGLSRLASATREHLPAHENAMLSPLSVGSLLGALYLGAQGDTAKQISEVLSLLSADDEVYWGQMAAALSAIHDSTALDAALVNGIFLDKNLALQPDFEHVIRRTQTYAEVVPMDFAEDEQESADYIHMWMVNKTHSKIPNIMQEPLPSDTSLVLTSALYFNGAWNDQFPKGDTKRAKFTISDAEAIEVHLMHHHAKALYGISRTFNCTMLGVAYKDEDFALFFVLPDEPGAMGVQNILNNMNPTEFVKDLNAAYWENVSYYVPRMRLETTLDLNNALFGAGANDLFVSIRADLSGMVKPDNVSGPLFVNRFAHSVVLDVTESGTEQPSPPPEGPHAPHPSGDDGRVQVRVDRPFILVLQHRPTSVPVIWATVFSPTPSYPLRSP